jgi:hypothetical protein
MQREENEIPALGSSLDVDDMGQKYGYAPHRLAATLAQVF